MCVVSGVCSLFSIFKVGMRGIGCMLLSVYFDDIESVIELHDITFLFPYLIHISLSLSHTYTHTLNPTPTKHTPSSFSLSPRTPPPRTHTHTHTHIRSVSHTMHFKQKGISGLSWKELPPGQTTLYVFDDPLKPRKLLLHCGHSILNPKR